jgi:protein involved in polysaccharide export with SLBB domain
MKPALILLMLLASFTSTRAQHPAENREPVAAAPAAEVKKVCVIGGVVKPSEITFNGYFTVTHAIDEAGGLAHRKKNVDVVVISSMGEEARSRLIYVDLEGARARKPFRDLELQNYDVVYVAPLDKDRKDIRPSVAPCPSWPTLKVPIL